jgi:hypothetical protein
MSIGRLFTSAPARRHYPLGSSPWPSRWRKSAPYSPRPIPTKNFFDGPASEVFELDVGARDLIPAGLIIDVTNEHWLTCGLPNTAATASRQLPDERTEVDVALVANAF